jgi:predicted SprT family Zn-dependent metalloprotease
MTPTFILLEVRNIALQLINEHLYGHNYKFEFDTAKRRFGWCSWTKKKITISKALTLLNWEENKKEVIDVIKHEIAHALTRAKYGSKVSSHGWEWKQMCIKIGARPERCYSAEKVVKPQGKYQYKCPHCEKIVQAHKLKKSPTACGRCCRLYNNNKYTEKFNLVLVA